MQSRLHIPLITMARLVRESGNCIYSNNAMRVLILLFIPPLCFSSCQRLNYEPEWDGEYVWKGSFKDTEPFSINTLGCVGSLNACNGQGEAKIKMNMNSLGGIDFFFYYNGRLIKKLVTAPTQYSSSYSHTFYDQNGSRAFSMTSYHYSDKIYGVFVEGFPFTQAQNGQKYMNYFEADF